MKRSLLFLLGILSVSFFISFIITGCAQVGSPTGGPRDTIAPKLVSAQPNLKSTNFKGNKIVLTFDEYVDVQDVQTNVLVSPFPKNNPTISFKLKTVTIKLKDTLKENTTYAINFGNAIRDNNEGNPFKNFTYVFSTGNTVDSLTLSGKIFVAETGKPDSTISAILYRNAHDSSVQTRKPDYLTKLDGQGNFTFTNLSAGSYKVYALKDGDGGKTYNSAIEEFAFIDEIIMLPDSTKPVTLYAYAEEKDSKKTATTKDASGKSAADKRLKYATSLTTLQQDLNNDLVVTFNRKIKTWDSTKIQLTDTLFSAIPGVSFRLDSTKKLINIQTKWPAESKYYLIINKEVVTDTLGTQLVKTDTLKFKTKKLEDYGNISIRFANLVKEKHPVLLFLKGDVLVKSVAINSTTWSDKLMEPGEYELRILYDDNNNGKWDPGNYKKKIQPEKGITLDKKLTIKANWDNEREVKL